jgi:hypothetical protein
LAATDTVDSEASSVLKRLHGGPRRPTERSFRVAGGVEADHSQAATDVDDGLAVVALGQR